MLPWIFLALGIGYVALAGKAKPVPTQPVVSGMSNRLPLATLRRAAMDPGLRGKRARLALRLRLSRMNSHG